MDDLPRNWILRILEKETRHRVLDRCRSVELRPTMVLSRAGSEQTVVHFPETCVVSSVAAYSDGSTIEVANTGREGCTGLGPILDSTDQLNTDIVQVGGQAYAMDTEDFLRVKEANPGFRAALYLSMRGMFHQVMVSGACNATHSARKRLARWLLAMADRTSNNRIPLTQEFLADILGVRRATISEAASAFNRQGYIDQTRGGLTVLDHEGLRTEACECYDLVVSLYDRLMPAGYRSREARRPR